MICFSRIFIFFVAMDSFYKSYVETDLTTLHYITFIKLFGVFSTETLSFNSEQFTNNSNNKEFKSKTNDHFLLFQEHFFIAVLVYK
jgi:hypothetical protein